MITIDLFYVLGMLLLPFVFNSMCHLKSSYQAWIMSSIGLAFVIACVIRAHGWWIYSGMIVSYIVALSVGSACNRTYSQHLHAYGEKIKSLEQQINEHKQSVSVLEQHISTKEKDIERSMYMYSIVKGLAETISWKTMIPVIGRALKRFLGTEQYALYVTGEEVALKLYYRAGTWPQSITIPQNVSAPVYTDPAWALSDALEQRVPQGSVAIPFSNEGKLFGLLLLIPENIQNDVLEEASALQVQLLFGMERAKLYHDIEVRSVVDGLTTLYRRQYFDLKLQDEIARAELFHSVFGLAMLDIDHFKKINDMYGHQTGDMVLTRIGTVCGSHFYETDFCARYGGEEFVILCPRSEPEGLMRKIIHLHKKICAEQFVYQDQSFNITVSIGIAHFPHHGRTAHDIVSAVDQALYTAKKAGRNCIKEFGTA